MDVSDIYRELKGHIEDGKFYWGKEAFSDDLENIFLYAGIFPLELEEAQAYMQQGETSLTGVYSFCSFEEEDARAYFRMGFGKRGEEIIWSVHVESQGTQTTLKQLCQKLPQVLGVAENNWFAGGSLLDNIILENFLIEIDRESVEADADYPCVFTGRLWIPSWKEWEYYPFLCEKSMEFTGRAAFPYQSSSAGWSFQFRVEAGIDGIFPLSLWEQNGSAGYFGTCLQLVSHTQTTGSKEKAGAFFILNMNLPGVSTPARFSFMLFGGNLTLMAARFENGLSASSILNLAAEILQIKGSTEQLLFPNGLPGWDLFRLYGINIYLAGEMETKLPENYSIWEQDEQQDDIGPYSWQVTAMSILAGLSKPQTLPIPLVTLESLACELEVTNAYLKDGAAEQNMLFQIGLAGDLAVTLGKGYVLRVYGTAFFPQYQFTGVVSLDTGGKKESAYTYQDIAACFQIPVDSPLTIAAMMIMADVKQRSVSLMMNVKDIWEFSVAGLVIEIKGISAELSVYSSGISAGLSGVFQICAGGSEKAAFYLEGGYAKESWYFEGGLRSGKLHILDVVQALFIPDYEPDSDSIWDICLEELKVSVLRGTEEVMTLHAVMSTAWKLVIFGETFLIRGRVDYERKPTEKRLDVGGEISLGSFLIRLTVQNVTDSMRSFYFRVQFMKLYLDAVYEKMQAGKEVHDILTVKLGGCSVGDLIVYIGNLINPNADFKLSPPWDCLEKIYLDRFKLVMDMTSKSVSFLYEAKLNLAGLIELEAIGLRYEGRKSEESLNIVLTGRFLDKTYEIGDPLGWDLQNEEPPSAGRPDKFKLVFVSLGQHVSCPGLTEARSIEQAAEVMKKAVAARELPVYDRENGFLIAAEAYLAGCIRAQLVLNDPYLYGLKLTVVKAGSGSWLENFNGLELELLYRKITSSIGMFQVTLMMPEKYRHFSMGIFSVTLGEVSASVYTNGNFMIDLGFPHQRDFTRSFVLQAGAYVGRGGLYFGVLSGDTAEKMPKAVNGIFDPVIAVGVGLSIGIGRSFDFGIVKGGMTLEIVGIFEGMFAEFHPYDEKAPKACYYRMEATVGLIGRLWLCVDLKIIAICASLEIEAYASVCLESCEPAVIALDLALRIKAYIKILFIKIKFSFQFKQHFEFKLGEKKPAPWTLEKKAVSRMRLAGRENGTIKETINERIWKEGRNKLYRNGTGKTVKVEIGLFPGADLAESSGNQILAVLPIISMEEGDSSFYSLTDVLAGWFLEGAASGDYFYADDYARLDKDFKGQVTYKWIQKLLEGSLNFGISLGGSTAGNEMDGVIFPMFPELHLSLETCENEEWKVSYEADYWQDTLVSDEYLEMAREYFEKLMMQEPDSGIAAACNGETPFGAFFMEEYFTSFLKSIVQKAGSYFESYTYDGRGKALEEVCAPFQEPGRLLYDNKEMVFRDGLTLTITGYEFINGSGSLWAVHEKWQTPWDLLWNDVKDRLYLLKEEQELALESRDYINSRKMNIKWLAAFFYVRFYEEHISLDVSQVQLRITQMNEIGPDYYEMSEEGRSFQLEVSGERAVYQSAPGDTVERIAYMNCILEQSFPAFLESFKELNQAEEEDILPTVKLPPVTCRIRERTMGDLARRFLLHRGIDETNPLVYQEILGYNTPLTLSEVRIPAGGRRAVEVAGEYGLPYDQMAEGLKGVADPFTASGYVIRSPQALEIKWLREQLCLRENIESYAAMLSRICLQGLRLPREKGEESTEALFAKLSQLIKLADYGLGGVIKGKLTKRECTYLSIEGEEHSWDIDALAAWFPAGYLNPRFCLEPGCAPAFAESNRTYNTKEYADVRSPKAGGRFYWLGEDFEEDACDGDTYEIPGSGCGASGYSWACIIPLAVKKSDHGYCMYGAEAKDRARLYELSKAEGFTLSCIFRSSEVSGLGGACYEDQIDYSNVILIRQNLSRISRRTYRENLLAAGKDIYAASMDEPGFAGLLWKCSVVQGGYHFVYETEEGGKIQDDLFNEEGIATLYLLAVKSEQAAGYVSCCNGIWIPGQGEKQENLYLQGIRTAASQKQVQHLSAGGKAGICFALEEEEEPPMPQDGAAVLEGDALFREWLTRNQYHAAAYRILENESFMESGWSYPLLPVENGTYKNYYQSVLPLSEFAKKQEGGPYAGLGQKADIELAFRDIYGNEDAVRRVVSVRVLYQDALYDVTRLPFAKWEYDLEAPEKGGRQMAVLSFGQELYNCPKDSGAYERLRNALWQYSQEDVRMSFSSGLDASEYELDKNAAAEALEAEKEMLGFLSQALPYTCGGASAGEMMAACRGDFKELSDEGKTLKEIFAQPDGLTLPDFVETVPQMSIAELLKGKSLAKDMNKSYPLRRHIEVETEEFGFTAGKGVESFEKAAQDNDLPVKGLILDNQGRTGILKDGFLFKWKDWETETAADDSLDQICARLQEMSGEKVEADILVFEDENRNCLKEQASFICCRAYTKAGDTLGQNVTGLSQERFLELNSGRPGLLEPGGVLYLENRIPVREFIEEGITQTAIAFHMETEYLWKLWQDEPLREGQSFTIGRRFSLPEKLQEFPGNLYGRTEYRKGGHVPEEFSVEMLAANAWVCRILDEKTVFIQGVEVQISEWETIASLAGRLQDKFEKTAEEIWKMIKAVPVFKEEFVYLKAIEGRKFYFPMALEEETLLNVWAKISVTRTSRLPQDAPEDVRTVSGVLQIMPEEDGSRKGFIRRMESYKGIHAAWDDKGGLKAVHFSDKTISNIRISAENPVYAALRPLALQLMTRAGVRVPKLLEDGSISDEETEADFPDVDMEIWAQEFLNDFDRVLNMEVFCKPPGEDKGLSGDVAAVKEALMEAVAGQLEGLTSEGISKEVKNKIKSLLKNRLGESLTEGYAQSVWMAVPMECESAMRCRFPLVMDVGQGMEVFADKADTDDTAGYFVMQVKPEDQFVTALQPVISGRIADMEYEIVMREDGYEQSRWLVFDSPLEDERLELELSLREPVPVPLRQVPQEPYCISHRAVICQEGEGLLDYCKWDYEAVCEYTATMQDKIELTVHFQEQGRMLKSAPGKDLFDMLAGYKTVREPLLAQLEAGNRKALASFKELAEETAAVWEQWGKANLRALKAEREIKIPMQLDFGAEKLRLIVKEEMEGWSLRFYYLSQEEAEYEFIKKDGFYELEEKLDIDHDKPLRMKVCVCGLDIFDVQCARAKIQVIRNAELVPGKDVSEAFIYRGQLVSFPQKAEAQNTCSKQIMLGEAVGGDYAGAAADAVSLIRNCGLPLETGNLPYTMRMLYSYPLSQDGLRIELPVFMMPAADPAKENLEEAEAFLREWFETNKPKLHGGEITLAVTYMDKRKQGRILEFTRLCVPIV